MNAQLNPIILIAVVGALGLLVLFSGIFRPDLNIESLTAEEVLSRWADSLGGVEMLEAIKMTYSKGILETSGFSGDIEVWSIEDGSHRVFVDLGEVYRTTVVFDGPGNQGWQVDLNGSVQPLGGTELENEITTAYFESFSHLFSGRWDGVVEYLGEDRKTGHYILEITPTGGSSVTYFIDYQTFLPAKTEQQDGSGRTLTTTLSDWRDVSGVMFSFHSLQTTGNPLFNTTITTDELLVNNPVESTVFLEPEAAAPDFVFVDGWQSINIPIELNGSHIYLMASINDSEPDWFLLDSGAGITVLNKELADKFNVDLEGALEGSGTGEESVQFSLATGVNVAVQGVEISDQTVAAIPLSDFEPFIGRRIAGIIGSDFFNRFVVEIDYENLVLNLYDPIEYTYSGSGQAFPLIFEGSNPHFEASFSVAGQSLEGKFLIDTGSNGSVGFAKPFVDKHALWDSGIDFIQNPFGLGVGGESRSLIGRLEAFQLGDVIIENVLAGFSQNETGAMADPNSAGLIGGELLRRFHVIFDYSNQMMYLEPNANLQEPFESNMAGLVLRAEGEEFDDFAVFRVVEDAAADKAGIQEGDRIALIDGQPSSQFSLIEIIDLFESEDGRILLLQIQRGNQNLDIELTLERQI
jgi:predicted aspartyl protease